MLAGTTAPTPNPATAAQGYAVQLFSKAMGHLGGNDITAEFVARPARLGAVGDRRRRTTSPSTCATNAAGAPTSTAAQVRDAINAPPGRERARHGVPGTTATRAPASSRCVRGCSCRDYLAAPAHVKRGPFDQRVLRIGKQRDGTKTGVFIYCQQHAREWVTPITCLETAERLVQQLRDRPDDQVLHRQPRHLHPAVGRTRTAATTRSTTSAPSAATCRTTALLG